MEENRLFHVDTGLEAVSRVTLSRNVLWGFYINFSEGLDMSKWVNFNEKLNHCGVC